MHKHTHTHINVAEKCIQKRILVAQTIRNAFNGKIVLHILHVHTQRVVGVKWVAVDVIVASINEKKMKKEETLNRITRIILLFKTFIGNVHCRRR